MDIVQSIKTRESNLENVNIDQMLLLQRELSKTRKYQLDFFCVNIVGYDKNKNLLSKGNFGLDL